MWPSLNGGLLRLYTEVPSVRQVIKRPSLANGAEPERELRADAKRNREKLLVAADAVFSERGADASMEEVAKRAKVGIGTLYRHFPTREALLAAACDDRLLALAAECDALSASELPSALLETFLAKLVSHTRMYRGLAASLGVMLQNGSPGCHATTATGKELLERAQAAGKVRSDARFDDIVCMAIAISLAAAQTPSDPHRVERLVAMFVDGLRVPPARPPAKKARSR